MTDKHRPAPYCASLEWYRGGSVAMRHANRCFIGGGQTLTVPVAGGAAALKRLPYGRLEVSMHGRWPSVHLGALDAAYGRAPFFRHYFPEIERLLLSPPRLLGELCGGIDAIVRRALRLDETLPLLGGSRVYSEKRMELEPLADVEVSMLDALFRFGPEAIFLFAPPL